MHHHNPSRWRTLPAILATAIVAAGLALATPTISQDEGADPDADTLAGELAAAEQEAASLTRALARRGPELAAAEAAKPATCQSIIDDWPDHLAAARLADQVAEARADRQACKRHDNLAAIVADLTARQALANADIDRLSEALAELDAQPLTDRVTNLETTTEALADRLTEDEAELARVAAEAAAAAAAAQAAADAAKADIDDLTAVAVTTTTTTQPTTTTTQPPRTPDRLAAEWSAPHDAETAGCTVPAANAAGTQGSYTVGQAAAQIAPAAWPNALDADPNSEAWPDLVARCQALAAEWVALGYGPGYTPPTTTTASPYRTPAQLVAAWTAAACTQYEAMHNPPFQSNANHPTRIASVLTWLAGLEPEPQPCLAILTEWQTAGY